MDEFTGILFAAAGMFITALVTWITDKVLKWLNAKIVSEKTQVCAENIKHLVITIVQSTMQTYVKNLKETATWTDATKKQAMEMSLVTIKELLSSELKKFIIENFGNLDTWLENLIEAQIYSLKQ